MKRFFLMTLILLTFALCFVAIEQPEDSWAKRITQYLSQVSSTTTKLFTLNGDTVDTTAVFENLDNEVFWAHPEQVGDSVFVVIVRRLLPYNYADSTNYYVNYDSAMVTSAGPQLLKWNNFKSGYDSVAPAVPAGYYSQLFIDTKTGLNGYNTTLNIRLEAATAGDF